MNNNSLRKIRKSLMISKFELAKRANISPKTITRIENGLPCRMDTKQKIIRTLEDINADENETIGSFIIDNKDERSGIDRRQFSYDKHIPERRSAKDRRNRLDRRLKPRISKY